MEKGIRIDDFVPMAMADKMPMPAAAQDEMDENGTQFESSQDIKD